MADAATESIQGVIGLRAGQAYIRLTNFREALQLHGVTRELVADLQRLGDGDFIVGRGQILKDRRVVALESIDTVGLRQILGTWRTENWNVYDFRDFNRLFLYVPRSATASSTTLAPTRQLTYTLAPNARENEWSIFMADKKGVVIGEMHLRNRSMSLTLYDPKTGRVHQQLELAPFRR